MNNELRIGRRIKEVMARKALPTLLAGSMLFSGALVSEAQAYSLDEPSQSYEDFMSYQGVKVFINGRYVEFNNNTGYPFIDNGSTMIPLRAVSETFGAKVEWNDLIQTASVSKYDTKVDVALSKDDMLVYDLNDSSSMSVSITKNALVKDGRTYIPLRSLFECFGLNVRWDDEKQTAHIETVSLESLENIDFKEEKIYSISDLVNMKDVKTILFDGKEIDREYLNILSESNQYVVIVKNDNAQVFSYQFLSDLNYFYTKEKELNLKAKENPNGCGKIILRNFGEEALEFFPRLVRACSYELQLAYNSKIYEEITDMGFSTVIYANGMLVKVFEAADKIIEEIRNTTSDKKEQAELLVHMLHRSISYDFDGSSMNNIYGALVNKDTKCNGFAYAFNYIARELGLWSLAHQGNSSSSSHIWNDLYFDGEWSIYDATNNVVSFPLSEDGIREKYSINEEGYNEDLNLIKLTYKFGD